MAVRIDPEVAAAEMRAAGVEPLEPYPGAKAPWRCECTTCGSEVTPRLSHVRNGATQGACRFCSYKRFGDSIKLDPDTAVAEMLAAGVVPLEPYTNSSTPWRSRCLTCDEEVTPLFSNVKNGHAACVYCAERRSTPESATADMRAAGVEPLEPYPGTSKPWLCRCNTCGNEITPRLNGVRHGDGACRFCGSIRGGEAIRIDSATAVAEMRAAGVEPLEPYTGTKTPWLCRCNTCGKESTPSLGTVRSGGGACRPCGIERRAEPLRVNPEDAVEEMRAAGVEPLEPYSGLGKNPWLCRCLTCGEEGRPRLSTVRRGHGACRFCAPGGFAMQEPGTLYLFRHDAHRSLKIGITNDETHRLLVHERHGWSLVDMWFFDIGAGAYRAEQEVLDAWSVYEPGVANDDMPQSGYTETVSLNDVSEAEAVAMIEAAISIAGSE
jgi:hypothetical protein